MAKRADSQKRRADSKKPCTVSPDEAAWLMAITEVLTMQDMFDVVPKLLEHILDVRRRVPPALVCQTAEQMQIDGLRIVLSNMIAISRAAHAE